jgi:hypothetical protein
VSAWEWTNLCPRQHENPGGLWTWPAPCSDRDTSIQRDRGIRLAERQGEQGTGYCELRGWDTAHIAEDFDVTRAISPFERPKLGPWLTIPEPITRWDVLVVAGSTASRAPCYAERLAAIGRQIAER